MANISDVEAANIARFLGRKGREVTIADVKEMPQVQVDKLKKQMRGIGKNKGGMITKQYMNPVTIVDNLS
tara:strand:+ start:431 stop:640 length:210 start_codon:yes stop_codon:yes gene_type:complete